MYVTAMVAALSVAGGEIIFWILLFGESSAKFSMVLVASVGLPSKTGSSVPFVRAMSHRWRLVVASVTAIAPLALFGGPAAIAAIACSSGSFHCNSSNTWVWRNNGGRNRSFKRLVTIPVPTDTSLIAASFSDTVPRRISPSAKSASPSV